MHFTHTEQRFLGGSHSVGHSFDWPELPETMPPEMRQRALEYRATRLGNKFAEFRSRNNAAVSELASRLNAADLL
jgi:hypothetical protein